MATTSSIRSQAELLSRLSAIATANNGTAVTATDGTITGTLTAIKAKWFLGGRKVTSNFTCTLDTASHEAHFRESAVETTWGMPPPTLTVQTTSQYGTRTETVPATKSGQDAKFSNKGWWLAPFPRLAVGLYEPIFIDRSRSALATTDTELRLMAAAAIIGLSRRWLDSG